MGRPIPHPQRGFGYVLSQRTCQRCPQNIMCLTGGRKRHRLNLHRATDQDRPKGIRLAVRVRKVIERAFAEAEKWQHLGRARHRDRLGVAFQSVMTLLVMHTKAKAAWSGVDPAWQGA